MIPYNTSVLQRSAVLDQGVGSQVMVRLLQYNLLKMERIPCSETETSYDAS